MSDDARRDRDAGGFSNPLEELIGRLVEGFGDLGRPGDEPGGPPGAPPRGRGDTRTPTLDRFGRDLTAAARAGRLDPVVGREREVAAVLEILGRRTKNNPVLVGDPGVGKTAIVEGIAARIAEGTVPGPSGRRVVAIDLAGLVAGTKYRGEFEERLRRLVDEVTATDRAVVLFLDELHTVVGAGAGVEGTMDAADILKPALARGELQVVGATTLEEYRRHVESDPALERRFAPITVDEPTVEETVAILDGLRARYEDHHHVRLPEDARRAAVELTARHVRDRFLPDKAIDALDTAAARVRLRRGEAPGASTTVTVADVAQVVADRTGLPVAHLTDSERSRLLGLADHLRRRVVGQDHALEAVTDAVLAGRAGMGQPGRPVASFLFAGPTGVGKTELARALAEALHGSDERLVRLDLGEFREAHTVSRLTGAPPGYVGHDRPGELTEAIRRTPSCVVLLDEIEKAHPDVLALLLGVLDAGRLTDGRGRTVSFADAVVIMTSNLGATALSDGKDPDEARAGVVTALARALRPEFLGRIDEVVLFTPLDPEARHAVVGLMLDGTRERLAAQEIGLTVTPAAVDVLVARGHDPALGARPMRRVVTREVDRALSRRIVAGALRPGGHATVDAPDPDGPLTIEVGATPP
ncbi:ATP-dependent Clp protease ATP-binding subunit [Actinomycetospora chlora]|uniref:ATP-dependent Clp protease ATP-binding subunit n=1 Tax=Actinomycetospora chlora TaxID=663608 RepID=A0ABP9AT91_9PSEU